ncbi:MULTISPECIES: hypothetical protein [Pseudoalteromonas]|uniref:Tetratricopeptide repeat protein n=1 Tax=Pseudoalteromonas rubra TaxID=43658 RepID=A0A5S3V0L3_9GAMM|nr:MULTISPECIES: hypothetical protein [Pseudoalteromonas]MCG7560444.1 hypothetical protein [Pseudoalteromonas sp. McH1-42]MEC4087440.1 hypothetical protein [Pseudoalteromonas rubra]QPB83928.1 hypothetical protein CWC22_013380 [Pseudoalteromonas rubra]
MLQTNPTLNSAAEQLEHALAPWQKAITAGNCAFEGQSFYSARDHYQSALYLVSNLIAHFTHQYDQQLQEDALMHCCPALIVASHNLADCYLALGLPHKACEQLVSVHQRMVQLCDHANPQVGLIAMRHCMRTRTELMHFITTHKAYKNLVSWATQALNTPQSAHHYH